MCSRGQKTNIHGNLRCRIQCIHNGSSGYSGTPRCNDIPYMYMSTGRDVPLPVSGTVLVGTGVVSENSTHGIPLHIPSWGGAHKSPLGQVPDDKIRSYGAMMWADGSSEGVVMWPGARDRTQRWRLW
jgi:hypothetical protein